MTERLVIGRVAKAHGIRGEVAVEPLTDHADRFAVGASMSGPEGLLTVVASRPHQSRLLVLFKEIPDRNAAERLRGAELTVDASEAKPLPEGRWYLHQLEGLDVLLPDGTAVGKMVDVEENPAHDLWVVERENGRRVRVPVVFVTDVDLDEATIRIAPPEGLL